MKLRYSSFWKGEKRINLLKNLNNFNDTGVIKKSVSMTPVSFFSHEKTVKMTAFQDLTSQYNF
ncbi:hypothetical protein CWB72_07570 [Pseudoalteromonas phenolica]|nr:hypothetical protein CWB72_07570 [Pseudoalteromonas phenolica]